MRKYLAVGAFVLSLFASGTAAAQTDSVVLAADAALRAQDYERALQLAREGTSRRLERSDLIRAYEVMAFSLFAMDSTDAAIEAFREVVRSDPDRTYDPERFSPRVVQLHSLALSRELVIRSPVVDSVTFVAGAGGASIQFSVSRPASVLVRALGMGREFRIDSLRVADRGVVGWDARDSTGAPVAPGRYDILLAASEFRDRWERRVPVIVSHARPDTVPHLTAVPGLALLPEFEQPSRNWTPLVSSAAAAGLVSALVLAVEPTRTPATEFSRRELIAIDLLAVATGFVVSLRRPEPRRVESNVLYNQRVGELLAERNRQIAAENEQLRLRVLVTVVPVGSENQ